MRRELPCVVLVGVYLMQKEIVKTFKVKQGLVMRSLRAGLSGKLHGPDLIESWSILNTKGWDKSRLKSLLNIL